MKLRTLTHVGAVALFLVLAIPVRLAAQEGPQYTVVDMGTFGGPDAYINWPAQILNQSGVVTGWAATSNPDPNFPNFFSCEDLDCLYSHAFQWKAGTVTDLGTLPGGHYSQSVWISNSGLIAGIADNGATDPITGLDETRAVLWNNGQITNLGTLGGNWSWGSAVNNAGVVAGCTTNTTSDPYSWNGVGTETRAFRWLNGTMQDLGTLGGPDACAYYENDSGQIAGSSYTSATLDSLGDIPADPFLWSNGKMLDLGTLGGDYGLVYGMNNRGQVIGISYTTGDVAFHPFLYDGRRMIDLGTFGGCCGFAFGMNDAGEVVGWTFLPDNTTRHAFLWKNGAMQDLGVPDGDKCSAGFSINSQGQIAGSSGVCDGYSVHAILWENGKAIDLTSLAPPGIELANAMNINDLGEILCVGRVPNTSGPQLGVQHVFLLIPAGSDAAAATTSLRQERPNASSPTTQRPSPLGRRLNHGHPVPGPDAPPVN